jgi:hypothetical protein
MKALRFLLYPLIAISLVAVAAVLCIPVLLYLAAKAVWFRYKNRGKSFLVYTRRHGWNEFICNNLVPAFSPDIEPVEYPRGLRPWPAALSHVYAAGKNKPYLVKVSWSGVRYISLHELLLPLKRHGARQADVQAELRQILAAQVGSAAR